MSQKNNPYLRLARSRLPQLVVVILAVTTISFIISVKRPGDSVDQYFLLHQSELQGKEARLNAEENKRLLKERYGYYLPVFYVSVQSSNFHSNYFELKSARLRYFFKSLIVKGYTGRSVGLYLKTLEEKVFLEQDLTMEALHLSSFSDGYQVEGFPDDWRNDLEPLRPVENTWVARIPTLYFFKENQFHRWLFGSAEKGGLLKGNLGRSTRTGEKVSKRFKDRLKWSLGFGILALAVGLFFGVLLGLFMAYFNTSPWSSILQKTLFGIWSVPTFWMATMLLLLFANPSVLNLFPSGGVEPLEGIPSQASFWRELEIRLPFFVLPFFCFTYGLLAYVAKMTKEASEGIFSSSFVKSMRAKGFSEKSIILKSVLPNALLPLITIVVFAIPGLASGSVVIESIFSVPGMGEEIFKAALQDDLPVLMASVLLAALLTALGYLLGDFLYLAVDPRTKKMIQK